jgi:hypothetical protein
MARRRGGIVAGGVALALTLAVGGGAGAFEARTVRGAAGASTTPASPSTVGRFKQVRFGTVGKDATGSIIGVLGFGIDIGGRIRDTGGVVSVEQHLAMLPPASFHPLSSPDRASLAAALDNYLSSARPPVNPLWRQVLTDLKK